MFYQQHKNNGNNNADCAVQEQHLIFGIVHNKACDKRGNRLRRHSRGIVISRVLSHRFGRGKFGYHRESVDVCDNKTESGNQIEHRKQRGRYDCFIAGSDKEENKEERYDRKRESYHYRLSSAYFRRKRADGNKRYRRYRHTYARYNGRRTCRQVKRFRRIDRKV